MKIYLVRQAETQGNKEGRYGGYDESMSGFTEKGQKQLAAIHDYFSDKQIHEVFCSPKNKCYQTGQKIKTYLFATVMQLDDIQTGIFSGKTKDEAEQNLPGEVANRMQDPYGYSFPQGESYKDCDERVMKWFKSVHMEPDKEYCIVTHLSPILMLLKGVLNKSFNEVKNTFIAPGSISMLTSDDGKNWRLEELNKELVEGSDELQHKMTKVK